MAQPQQVVRSIPVDNLFESPGHHRSTWNHMAELRASIAERGVIHPLKVRPRDEGESVGGFEIVDGVCRRRAAIEEGLTSLPCLIESLDNVEAIIHQVAANRGRAGLHPMDEALYFRDLDAAGVTGEAIAKRLQFKRSDVTRRMRLVALGTKARKAFTANEFDEPAALAMSTLDEARQSDILAALDAGTLQPDEITGYVQREFTASLDDVPWRMSDEKLAVAAGACTACPKRSDVQRDLFGESHRGLRCLDVDCWRSKMEATWQAELSRPGTEPLAQAAESLFLPSYGRPGVMRSSGMVDADAACPHLTGHTWREATFRAIPEDGDAPTVYLARDQDGRPRFLMRESTVARIVKKSDIAQAEEASDIGGTPSEIPDKAAIRAAAKMRKATIRALAEAAVLDDNDTWCWVVERVVEGSTPRALASAADLLGESIRQLDTAGLDGKAGLLELARESDRQARRVATAVLIYAEADVANEVNEPLRLLAALCEHEIEESHP